MRLSFHLGEVDVALGPLGEQRGQVDLRLGQVRPAVQKVRQLGERASAEHAHARHHTGFGQILARQDERLEPRGARRKRDGQRPSNRPNRTFEPQLAEHRDPAQAGGRDLLRGGEDADRDRQVECRAVLANVGRGKIHRNPLERERVARVGQRGVHALPALLHRAEREADRDERGEAVGDVGLDIHEIRVDPQDGRRTDPGEHVLTL